MTPHTKPSSDKPGSKEIDMNPLLVLSLIASIAIVSSAGEVRNAEDPRVVKLYGNLANFSALTHAKKIEAFRIKHVMDGSRDQGRKRIRGYPILSGPVAVNKKLSGELGQLLQRKSTYDFARDKGCEMTPGVAIVFKHQQIQVELLLCFECDQLEIYVGNKNTGYEDFDPARPQLLKIVKQIFPKDPTIQALKSKPQ